MWRAEELAQREQETASLRKAVVQRDDMLTFLKSAHVKVVSLSGVESAKSAGAFLLYDNRDEESLLLRLQHAAATSRQDLPALGYCG